jgi:hypothetical protein
MNKYSYIIFLPLFLQLSFASDLSNADSTKIADFTKQEFIGVQRVTKELSEQLKKDTVGWYVKDDYRFYSNWKIALSKELIEDYKSAIIFYKKSYNINRFEESSYPVLLPLGRVYFLSNQKSMAKKILHKYLDKAIKEVNGDNEAEWGLSEEGKQELLKDIEFAKWLLSKI